MAEPPVHPGTVTFVDGVTQEITDEVAASEVPDGIKFAPDADGSLTPVVKIVHTTAGARRTIQQFGPAGQLLKITMQIMEG
jgi:hypothetical protein